MSTSSSSLPRGRMRCTDGHVGNTALFVDLNDPSNGGASRSLDRETSADPRSCRTSRIPTALLVSLPSVGGPAIGRRADITVNRASFDIGVRGPWVRQLGQQSN